MGRVVKMIGICVGVVMVLSLLACGLSEQQSANSSSPLLSPDKQEGVNHPEDENDKPSSSHQSPQTDPSKSDKNNVTSSSEQDRDQSTSQQSSAEPSKNNQHQATEPQTTNKGQGTETSEDTPEDNEASSQGTSNPPADAEKTVKDREVSLSEKIGQMVMIGMNGTDVGAFTEKMIRQQHIGGIILYGDNIQTPQQTVSLINQLKTINKKADNPLPLFISVDQEGGPVQRLPNAIAGTPSLAEIGETGSAQYARSIGKVLGETLNAFGFNMNYAPVLDVIRHPGQSVIGRRSFGSDPALVSRLGTAMMQGMQSEQVISVIKHFPGYGEVSTDGHKALPYSNVSLDRLQKVDWMPYRRAIAHGADAVLVTHILLKKIDDQYPSSMSHKVITELLRQQLGFQGVVITDDLTMGAIADNYGVTDAAVQAVKAGADIVMVSFHPDVQKAVVEALTEAVESGEISKQRIRESYQRIKQLKQSYHLNNHMTKQVNVKRINQQIQQTVR